MADQDLFEKSVFGDAFDRVNATNLLQHQKEMLSPSAGPTPGVPYRGSGRRVSTGEGVLALIVVLLGVVAWWSYGLPKWTNAPMAVFAGIAAAVLARRNSGSGIAAFLMVSVPLYFLLQDFGGTLTRVGPWVGYALLVLIPLGILISILKAFKERPFRSLLIAGAVGWGGWWAYHKIPPRPGSSVSAAPLPTLQPRSVTPGSAVYGFSAPVGQWTDPIVMPASATSMRLRSDKGVQLRMSIDGRETPYRPNRVRPGHLYRFMSPTQQAVVAEVIVTTRPARTASKGRARNSAAQPDTQATVPQAKDSAAVVADSGGEGRITP
jgi:hypothetical protein